MKQASDLKYILYEPGSDKSPMGQSFLSLDGPCIIPFADEQQLNENLARLKDSGVPSKEVLVLKEFKGRVFQKCPGSKGMICCNYYLINTCFDCLYDCAYCFLRSYLNSYGITQFTNTGRIFEEIESSPEYQNRKLIRLGTGEFTDSLMFDEFTGIASELIGFASTRPRIMLEFKTKSCSIDHLLDIPVKGNTVLAWSLNRQDMIDKFERGAASLEDRLEAARKAAEGGYYVAFHFDPLILTDGCFEKYLDIADRIFDEVDHEKIVWISMGGLRYIPSFREVLRFQKPDEELILSEMLTGHDGKMRYLKPERIECYRALLERIRSNSNRAFVYMCMESAEVWKAVFGADYKSSEDLENAFISHLEEYFI